MNICVVSNYKKNGYGESSRPYYLTTYLHELEHNILHLCNYQGYENGIEYIEVNTATWDPSLFKRIKDLAYLSYKVKSFKPDLIYVHQFNNVRWALASKALPAKPIVFDAHTSLYFEDATFNPEKTSDLARVKKIEADICQRADYIISASAETRDILQTTYELNAGKLFAVGNATSMEPVTDAELAKVKTGTQAPFTCIATLPFDGFLSNELALFYLFEVAKIVQQKNPDIVFKVLGGGNKPEPPTRNVIYTGYVSDFRQTILNANLCLMPYPDKAVCGGARNKFCDFVALGKIVVSTPEGMRGMQILEPGKNCIVAHSEQDFAESIVNLAHNAQQLNLLETEVLKIKDKFSWKDKALEVEQIFKQILKTKGS